MQDTPAVFLPPRRRGLLVHIGLITGLSLVIFLLLLLVLDSELGLLFLLYLLASLFLAVPLPFIIYRLSALLRSSYTLRRDGIQLRWGLRVADIPINEVLWVEMADNLTTPLTLPRLSWPGAVLGSTAHPDAKLVEFMSTEREGLVIIGTDERVYAISPEKPSVFLRIYQEKLEMGSMAPLAAYQSHPDFLLATIWRTRAAQFLLLPAFILSLALFIWVALLIGERETISLGFRPGGLLQDPVPVEQLFLLPVVNMVLLVSNFMLSLVFYRRDANHPLAYVLWGTSAITAGLFISAIYTLLQFL